MVPRMGLSKIINVRKLASYLQEAAWEISFLTGQNLNVHGALGVTLTAMLTCAEFVGQEYLAKKVGNA